MKPFTFPDYWTPDQALAVVDLLDEIREHIWAKYQTRLIGAYRTDHIPDDIDDLISPPRADDPF